MAYLFHYSVFYNIYLPVPANTSLVPSRVAKVHEELRLEFEATTPADALVVTTTSSRTALTIAAIISLKWKEGGVGK